MVKSHRSKRYHKKHRGGEGEATDNNSVLNIEESSTTAAEVAAPETATAMYETAPATAAEVAAPAEEEKKGWFSSLFGGSKKKHVRFRMTRKHKRSTRKHKRSGSKRSGSKRGGSKRSGPKRRSTKRKGSRK